MKNLLKYVAAILMLLAVTSASVASWFIQVHHPKMPKSLLK